MVVFSTGLCSFAEPGNLLGYIVHRPSFIVHFFRMGQICVLQGVCKGGLELPGEVYGAGGARAFKGQISGVRGQGLKTREVWGSVRVKAGLKGGRWVYNGKV